MRDPVTNRTYVLVRMEVYQRMQELEEDEMPNVGALINEVMAEDDANDPYLDGYQRHGREAS